MADYVAGGVPERLVPRTTEARNVGRDRGRRRAGGAGRASRSGGWRCSSRARRRSSAPSSARTTTSASAAPHWPPPGTPEPRVVVPLIMVGILATTSLPMQLAASAARRGQALGDARFLLVWALVVQCGYLVYEVHDYVAPAAPLGAAGQRVQLDLLHAARRRPRARRGRDPPRRLAALEARCAG